MIKWHCTNHIMAFFYASMLNWQPKGGGIALFEDPDCLIAEPETECYTNILSGIWII